jgi:alkanesulfonate monooxygenase SsuD/methylene tetrahydromethanopterin reductase-like flavin-dependent oxidoreductase (luciferase family)
MYFISITRLRVRSWRFMPMFFFLTARSVRQARKAAGNISTRLLADRGNTFWTATAWTSDVAMRQFMLAGAHRQAMSKLAEWCDEASVAHWNQEQAELPTWREAWVRLRSEGRKSKVQHPSPAHLTLDFPEPRA